MDRFHIPVLLKEALGALRVKKGGLYIDATIGGGGHTRLILDQGGRVLGIDQDEEAILHLKKKFESEIKSGKLILVRANFSDIEKVAGSNGFEKVEGILFDLGVSSHQLDEARRGFSIRRNEALDMRMSRDEALTAHEVVNKYSAEELYEVFAKYGEESRARDIAKQIVFERKIKPIDTTGELADLVSKIVRNQGKIHPATRVFQAIRIEVNSEIENLKEGVTGGFKLLKQGGRLAIISFHSLEDRVVKLYFLKIMNEGLGSILTKKPIVAANSEVEENRRSRSAKMRIIEKI